jgi:peptide/nickel transport system permease protein
VIPLARRVARRLLVALPLAWAVRTLVFLLIEAVPGRPFAAVEEPGVSRETGARLRRALGADRPAIERYASWLSAFVTGDLGSSYSLHRPVAGLVIEGLENTSLLAGTAIVVQFGLGTLAGMLAARRRGGWLDRTISASASALYAMPSFWIGSVLVTLLAVRLGWFPPTQMRSIDAHELSPLARVTDIAWHLVLPCLALALPAAGGIALYVRDEVAAALARAFARASRARGLSERRVLWRHGLAHALLPLAQLFGLVLPGVVGGSVLVEVLFAWPGMGRLLHQAVLARDAPLVLGCTWAGTVAVILGSLVADLLSALVDPRVGEAAT